MPFEAKMPYGYKSIPMSISTEMLYAFAYVYEERMKQDEKWGQQNHDPLKWNAILGEEFGEVSKAILEGDVKNYREELIQLAAVAVAAIENLDKSFNNSK